MSLGAFGLVFFLVTASTGRAQEKWELRGSAQGFVTVREKFVHAGSCLFNFGGDSQRICAGSRNIDRETSLSVNSCALSLVGDDAFLTFAVEPSPHFSSPQTYVLRDFANHNSADAYEIETSDAYSNWRLPVMGRAADPLAITTSYQILKIRAVFLADGRTEKVDVSRQTAPALGGRMAGSWLDRASCNF